MLRGSSVPPKFLELLAWNERRRWNLKITPAMDKLHFVNYAGRYIRRLPISQRRILSVTETEVVYERKITRNHSWEETRSEPAALITLLAQHIPDHYKHSMRYFGLLAPRSKHTTSAAMFLAIGHRPKVRLPRIPWRSSLVSLFGVDPLRTAEGREMQWIRRSKPICRNT
jgi:hypothetical protein